MSRALRLAALAGGLGLLAGIAWWLAAPRETGLVAPEPPAPLRPVEAEEEAARARPGGLEPAAADELSREVVRERAASAAAPRRALRVLGVGVGPLPAARAVAFADGRGFDADDAGAIDLSALEAGERLLVTAPGFEPTEARAPFGSGLVSLSAGFEWELELVWEDSGEPVVGAELLPRCERPDDPGFERACARVAQPRESDAHGRVRAAVSDCVYGYELRHPRAPRLQLPRELYETAEQLPVRLSVPRAPRALRLRFVDGAGAPLAGADVRLQLAGWEWSRGRTDAAGAVELDASAVRGDEPEVGAVALLLFVQTAAGPPWIAAAIRGLPESLDGRTFVVAPRAVRGLLLAADPTQYEVATAFAREPSRRESLFGHAPRAARLTWVALDADGAFELTGGWQGPEVCVLARHRAGGALLDWELAAPGRELVLEPRPTCRIALELADDSAPVEALLTLDPEVDGVPTRSLPPLRWRTQALPAQLLLPRGRYHATLRASDARHFLPILDASGAEARLLVRVPPLRAVSGRVRGELSGPMPELEVELHASRPGWIPCVTDARGRFEAELLAEGRVRAAVRHPSADAFPDWRAEAEAEDGELELVLPEARLSVEVRPPHAWTGQVRLGVLGEVDGVRGGRDLGLFEADAPWRGERLVPPGVHELELRGTLWLEDEGELETRPSARAVRWSGEVDCRAARPGRVVIELE